MNTYHIHYYGLLADRRGAAEETIRSAAHTPSGIYQEVLGTSGGITQDHIRAVVNDEFVPWDHPLRDQDRIAFLPPMSGG